MNTTRAELLRERARSAGALEPLASLVSSSAIGAGSVDDVLEVLARLVPDEGLPALWRLFTDPRRLLYATAFVEGARQLVKFDLVEAHLITTGSSLSLADEHRQAAVALGVLLLRSAQQAPV